MGTHYYLSIQYLRVFAFFAIFYAHLTVVSGIYSTFGVTIFFVISGFLSYCRAGGDQEFRNSFMYAWKHIKKLYWLFIIVLPFSIFSEIFVSRKWLISELPKSAIELLLKVITNVTLVSSWLPKSYVFSEFNIVTWYLSISVLLYLLTPTILKVADKVKLRGMVIITLLSFSVCIAVFSFAARCGYSKFEWLIYESPIMCLSEYLCGILVGMFIKGKIVCPVHKKKLIINWIVSCVLAFGIIIFTHFVAVTVWRNGIIWAIPSMFLVYSAVVTELSCERKREANKGIMWLKNSLLYLGAVSGYMYLVSVPIINYTHAFLKRLELDQPYWAIISTLLTITFAIIYDMRKKKRVGATFDSRPL